MAAPVWVGTLETAIAKYSTGVEHILSRYRPELALCMRRAKKDKGSRYASYEYRWQVQVDRPRVVGISPGEEVTFERHRLERQALIGPVKESVYTAITKEDYEISGGSQGLVNLVEERENSLEEALAIAMGSEMLTNDGYAVGTSNLIHGMDSFTGHNGVALSDNKRLTPTDTYATLATNLGTFGGTSETDDQYSVWSPTIVNVNGTGFSAFGTGWAERALDVLDFSLQHVAYRNADPTFVDAVFLHPNMFTDVIGLLRTKDHYLVQRGQEQSDLVDMGFQGLKYGPCELVPTYSVTDGNAYGLNCSNVTWWSIHKSLFSTEQDYYMANQTFRWMMYFYGNTIFRSPNRHFKLVSL